MTITHLQLLWLNSQGGRNITDVIEMGGQLFTPMSNWGTWRPVMIPSDKQILKEYYVASLPVVLRRRKRPLGK